MDQPFLNFIWVYVSIHFFVVGRDGPPTSPLRGGQTGGGRVRVSFPCLCSGDPLQRSKIIRNTHFPCSLPAFFFTLQSIILPIYCLLFLPLLSSSKLIHKLLCSMQWPDSLDISLFTKLDCELDISRQYVLLSSKSNSSSSCTFLFLGDVSEQTGAGRPTQCTWRWCSELPINLGDICGGK